MQLQLASIGPSVQRELKRVGIKLVVISSSSGSQVHQSVLASPENSLPMETFFGDPQRDSYNAVHAESGVFHTLVYGLAQVPAWLARMSSLVLLGAVMGASRQHLRGEGANWQQGAAAGFAADGELLWRHVSRHPMDLGQPLLRHSAALRLSSSSALRLDYPAALDRVSRHHPFVWALQRALPWILLAVALLLIALLLARLF